MPSPLQDVLQQLLGPGFRVERELSGAGMSRVFVAREVALDRDVVVKVLPPDLVTEKSIGRFRREIELTTRLQHPHILPVITAGASDHLLWYVAPYIHGRSLKDRFAAGERLGFDEALRVAVALLDVVAFAHERGVVHRDIKPGNVLLSEGHPILADFGIASAIAADDDPHHGSSSVAASPVYVAPEHPAGPAADLYAAATLVHEVLTGVLPDRPPRADRTVVALLSAHPELGRERARALAAVLTRARATDPAGRFESAMGLRDALRVAAVSAAVRRSRSRLIWVGAAAAAAVAAVAAILLESRVRNGPAGTAVPVETGQSPLATIADAAGRTTEDDAGEAVGAEDLEARPATPSFARFDSAVALLAAGQLVAAESLLRQEIRANPAHARAQLHVALVAGLYGSERSLEEARGAAARAIALGGLDAPDLALAVGVAALTERRFPDACEAFERARRLRPDMHSWMGAAECRARDDLVVAENGGFRFRSSYPEAARAYVEGIRSVSGPAPSVVYRRLASVLLTDANQVRRGTGPDGRPLVAFPLADADSIVFVPAPPGPPPTGDRIAANVRARAIARSQLRPVLSTWARLDAQNPAAREMFAELLEADGNIREPGADGVDALSEIRAARRLPANQLLGLSLARAEVRLLLRAREFGAAAGLADSLLAAHPHATPQEAEYLLGLAMATGKADAATRLLEVLVGTPQRMLRDATGMPVEMPAAVARERAGFVVAAVMGACTGELRGALGRLVELLDGLYPPAARPRGLEAAFIERPLVYALPCLGFDAFDVLRERSPGSVRLAAAHEPAQHARMLAEFDALDRVRDTDPLRTETTESVLVESWARLAAGDSLGTKRLLARTLDHLPIANRTFLHAEVPAATLPRVMMLRAELALAQGEDATARYWARAVAELWANAEEPLHEARERMRLIADPPTP